MIAIELMIYVNPDLFRRAVGVPADHVAAQAVERIGLQKAVLHGVTPWHLSHVVTT